MDTVSTPLNPTRVLWLSPGSCCPALPITLTRPHLIGRCPSPPGKGWLDSAISQLHPLSSALASLRDPLTLHRSTARWPTREDGSTPSHPPHTSFAGAQLPLHTPRPLYRAKGAASPHPALWPLTQVTSKGEDKWLEARSGLAPQPRTAPSCSTAVGPGQRRHATRTPNTLPGERAL